MEELRELRAKQAAQLKQQYYPAAGKQADLKRLDEKIAQKKQKLMAVQQEQEDQEVHLQRLDEQKQQIELSMEEAKQQYAASQISHMSSLLMDLAEAANSFIREAAHALLPAAVLPCEGQYARSGKGATLITEQLGCNMQLAEAPANRSDLQLLSSEDQHRIQAILSRLEVSISQQAASIERAQWYPSGSKKEVRCKE